MKPLDIDSWLRSPERRRDFLAQYLADPDRAALCQDPLCRDLDGLILRCVESGHLDLGVGLFVLMAAHGAGPKLERAVARSLLGFLVDLATTADGGGGNS